MAAVPLVSAGPNVATPTYEDLLPCYKKALDRLRSWLRRMADQRRRERPRVSSRARRWRHTPYLGRHGGALWCATPSGTPQTRVASGAEDPFYVIDLERALERLAMWRAELPEIEPFYAVKCNGDPALLLTLAHQGVNFDCASHAELKQLLDLGVSASRLVYANPIKQPSHLRFARQHGVDLTVFDGVHELHKLAATHPTCKLLLRIAVDDSQAQCVLSNKYGADPREAESLLDAAAKLGLTVAALLPRRLGHLLRQPLPRRCSRAAEIFSPPAARTADDHPRRRRRLPRRRRAERLVRRDGGGPSRRPPHPLPRARRAPHRRAWPLAASTTAAVSVIGKKVVERSPPQGEAAAAAAASSGRSTTVWPTARTPPTPPTPSTE